MSQIKVKTYSMVLLLLLLLLLEYCQILPKRFAHNLTHWSCLIVFPPL